MAKGIFERNNKAGDVTYYIRYQYQGRDIKESVGRRSRGFTREMARQSLNSRLGDIAQGKFNLEKARKPIPFRKLAERYAEYAEANKRAWKAEKHTLEMLLKFIKPGTPLANITDWRLEQWKTSRAKKVKQNTVNRQINMMKHLFAMAVQWKLMAHNPAKDVKRFQVDDKRTRFLTEEEVPVFLKACEDLVTSPWLYPLIVLALHTGLRLGELLGLRWENIDMARGVITIRQSKTLHHKTVDVNDNARRALEWLQNHRYGEFLFMWPLGPTDRENDRL